MESILVAAKTAWLRVFNGAFTWEYLCVEDKKNNKSWVKDAPKPVEFPDSFIHLEDGRWKSLLVNRPAQIEKLLNFKVRVWKNYYIPKRASLKAPKELDVTALIAHHRNEIAKMEKSSRMDPQFKATQIRFEQEAIALLEE